MYQKRGFAPTAAADPAGGSPAGGYVRRLPGGPASIRRRAGSTSKFDQSDSIHHVAPASVHGRTASDAVAGWVVPLMITPYFMAPMLPGGDCAVGQAARPTATWTTDAAAAPR